VVFLTASVIESDVDRLAAQDVSRVLGKPFDPMRLPAEPAELLGW
jgi:CheY-like chemotaxis protein